MGRQHPEKPNVEVGRRIQSMRVRFLSIAAAGALLVAVGMSFAPAGATGSPASAARATGTSKAWRTDLTILVNQIGSAGVYSILSQDFTDPGFDIYDSQLADDFTVPSTLVHGWKVQGMRAVGIFFNGAGPCDSETVVIYKDAGGVPGAVVATEGPIAGTLTAGGTYTVVFPSAVLLAKGFTYWASMVCTMAYSAGGEWGWSDRTVLTGNTAKWQNPGGGFGVCATWADMDTCVGISGEPDLQFALAGAAA
jgi:hypothetical protein